MALGYCIMSVVVVQQQCGTAQHSTEYAASCCDTLHDLFFNFFSFNFIVDKSVWSKVR